MSEQAVYQFTRAELEKWLQHDWACSWKRGSRLDENFCECGLTKFLADAQEVKAEGRYRQPITRTNTLRLMRGARSDGMPKS